MGRVVWVKAWAGGEAQGGWRGTRVRIGTLGMGKEMQAAALGPSCWPPT